MGESKFYEKIVKCIVAAHHQVITFSHLSFHFSSYKLMSYMKYMKCNPLNPCFLLELCVATYKMCKTQFDENSFCKYFYFDRFTISQFKSQFVDDRQMDALNLNVFLYRKQTTKFSLLFSLRIYFHLISIKQTHAISDGSTRFRDLTNYTDFIAYYYIVR